MVKVHFSVFNYSPLHGFNGFHRFSVYQIAYKSQNIEVGFIKIIFTEIEMGLIKTISLKSKLDS